MLPSSTHQRDTGTGVWCPGHTQNSGLVSSCAVRQRGNPKHITYYIHIKTDLEMLFSLFAFVTSSTYPDHRFASSAGSLFPNRDLHYKEQNRDKHQEQNVSISAFSLNFTHCFIFIRYEDCMHFVQRTRLPGLDIFAQFPHILFTAEENLL